MSRHVLIARCDNDGDVLLAGPAIRAVAASGARVTLLCGPRGEQAARLLPHVDDIVVWRAPWIDPEPEPVDAADVSEFTDSLWELAADEAIILTSFHQSPLPLALLARLAGIGFVGATSVDYPGSLLDVRHRIADDVHEVERSLSLMAACGHHLPPADDGRLAIRRDATGERPPLPAEPYVVVHPGASMPARAWSPDRNAELVADLDSAGWTVVVTGAPSERHLTARVAAGNAHDFGGRTDLAGLAEVIAAAEAIVVGNTGPAHLAAAVGTPVVSVYAPTVPAVRWRPWRVPHVLLHRDVACAGCRARDCPVPGHPCVDDVVPRDVMAAIEKLTRQAVPA